MASALPSWDFHTYCMNKNTRLVIDSSAITRSIHSFFLRLQKLVEFSVVTEDKTHISKLSKWKILHGLFQGVQWSWYIFYALYPSSNVDHHTLNSRNDFSTWTVVFIPGILRNNQVEWRYHVINYDGSVHLWTKLSNKPSFPSMWTSLVAQLVKNLPVMQETWVQSLGWEDPLEKGKATHSSILAWRIPRTV